MTLQNIWLAQSHYSFLQGASHPKELVNEALHNNYTGICVSDFDGFYGLVKSWNAAKNLKDFHISYGVQLPVQLLENYQHPLLDKHLVRFFKTGAPVFLQNRISYVATSKNSYAELCALTSFCHANQKTAQPLNFNANPRWPQQSIAIVPQRGVQQLFSPREGELYKAWEQDLAQLRDLHQGNFFLACTPPSNTLERNAFENHIAAHKALGIPLVATDDVFFHNAEQKPLHDILTTIRFNKPLSQLSWACFSNSERRVHNSQSLTKFFEASPTLKNAAHNNIALRERISFSPQELRYQYPREFLPENHTPNSYLTFLVEQALEKNFGAAVPFRMQELVHKELALVRELNFADYFLTVWDIVRFARSQKILCQGRGSAANSAMCFLLGITSVDPMVSDVLFERFLSKERGEPPDIDIDFEHERREEVIQYIYNRYGRERAAMVANVITFRNKGAIRAVAKSLEICEEKALRILRKGEKPTSNEEAQKFETCKALAHRLVGFPRHLGIHSGGFVIGQEPLHFLTPIEPATMPGRSVIQWNKDDIEDLGFFKIDVLALGMLTALRKTFALLESRKQRVPGTLVPIQLHTIPQNCEKTYAMIRAAKTTGVFQIESRAQMAILPKILPKEFYDLVVSIGIVRPGPIVSGMVHSYVARKLGRETPVYPDPKLKPILERTLGVPIFQEQVMRVAMAVADFTPGEADELRRCMGAWKLNGDMKKFENKLRSGMKKNKIPDTFADLIFKQIEGFSQYGFPESHATSFAFLAYASAWLKANFPAEFLCALLNSQPLGFYSPHSLMQEAKQCGVRFSNPCALESQWDSIICANGSVRLGFKTIPNLRENAFAEYISHRKQFTKNEDCFEAMKCLSQSEKIRLAMAGCFDFFNKSRRDILWKILEGESLILESPPSFVFGSKPEKFENWDNMRDDLKHKGYAIDAHPMAALKKLTWPFNTPFSELSTSQDLRTLKHNAKVTVAGLVSVRQRPPTAKGMMFITLEDECGCINIVIKPHIQEKFRKEVFESELLCCSGIRQSNGTECTVLASEFHEHVMHKNPKSQSATKQTQLITLFSNFMQNETEASR